MSRTYRTPKGTDLPLMLLKGKEYLEVKFRVVWFREERPEWRIETEFVHMFEDCALAKATIRDQSGNIMATAHKFEDRAGFADFREKAETGALGRALALIGYGTQFCADELDEGARIVDAPVAPAAPRQIAQGAPRASSIRTAESGLCKCGGKLMNDKFNAGAKYCTTCKTKFPAGA